MRFECLSARQYNELPPHQLDDDDNEYTTNPQPDREYLLRKLTQKKHFFHFLFFVARRRRRSHTFVLLSLLRLFCDLFNGGWCVCVPLFRMDNDCLTCHRYREIKDSLSRHCHSRFFSSSKHIHNHGHHSSSSSSSDDEADNKALHKSKYGSSSSSSNSDNNKGK